MNEETKSKVEVTVVNRKKSTPSSEVSRTTVEENVCSVIRSIAEGLVSYPEDVSVSFARGDKTTIYNIDCTQRVIGQIIGSKGKIIQSVRTIAMSMSCLHGFRAVIEIPYFDPNK